jgi:hypothetical protein
VGIDSGIFSGDAQVGERLRENLDDLEQFVSHLRAIGLQIVLTSGSFDLIHLGHVKYGAGRVPDGPWSRRRSGSRCWRTSGRSTCST